MYCLFTIWTLHHVSFQISVIWILIRRLDHSREMDFTDLIGLPGTGSMLTLFKCHRSNGTLIYHICTTYVVATCTECEVFVVSM
jgi:hypothetical protein